MSPLLLLGWAGFIGLVSHRVWRMAAIDSIFDVPRSKIMPNQGFWVDLLDCPWCLGFWLNVVGGIVLLATGTTTIVESGLVALAGSTVTGVIGRGD